MTERDFGRENMSGATCECFRAAQDSVHVALARIERRSVARGFGRPDEAARWRSKPWSSAMDRRFQTSAARPGRSADVHDAFQAVFWVLARWAKAIASVTRWRAGFMAWPCGSRPGHVSAVRRGIRDRRTARLPRPSLSKLLPPNRSLSARRPSGADGVIMTA